jgi:hypothetical protein
VLLALAYAELRTRCRIEFSASTESVILLKVENSRAKVTVCDTIHNVQAVPELV